MLDQKRKENIMKKVAWITLLVSGMAFAATAQERGKTTMKSAEEIAQIRTDQLTERLGLNEAQQKEVYALNLEKAEQRKAERLAKMAEMRTERKAEQERLEGILNEEQRELLKQQQAERKENMKEALKDGKFRGKHFKREHKGKRGLHKQADPNDVDGTAQGDKVG